MKQKKILCLIDSLSFGGAQRQMVGLAALLREHNYDVAVYTYYDIPSYKKYLDEKGVPNKTIDNATSILTRTFKVYNAIKKFSPDVVIAYLDTPCLLACMCRKLGLKYKLIVSERNTTQILDLRGKIKFFSFRIANYIVSNSYSQETFIREHFPELSDKVKTITNFVDTDFFSPLAKLSQQDGHRQLEILCIGRLVPQKNVLRFIDAIDIVIKQGHKVHVKWFGMIIKQYYERCMKKIQTYGLVNYFEFLESSNDIRQEYLKADVFCLPSTYEGFPNVLCEAMCCGLPILCSNVCDNPKIVADAENGFLFSPISVDDMANKIISYIQLDKEKIDQMKQVSRTRSLELFSEKEFVKSYMKLIN